MASNDSAEARDAMEDDEVTDPPNDAERVGQGIGDQSNETPRPARRHVVKAASALLGGAAAGAFESLGVVGIGSTVR